MKHLLSYTVDGDKFFEEVNLSLHLALSDDGVNYLPLRNNTGVLFCEAEYDEEHYKGITKFMSSPWIFKAENGFGLAYLRYTKSGADLNDKINPRHKRGYVCVCFTEDFIEFSRPAYLGLSDGEIYSCRVKYEGNASYFLEWSDGYGYYSAYTKDFSSVCDVKQTEGFSLSRAKAKGVENCVPFADVEISDDLAKKLMARYGRIYCVGVKEISVKIKAGETPALPKAEFVYNDGSTHLKKVFWEEGDFSKKGEYAVKGKVKKVIYPFPFIKKHISDPCVTLYNGKYYLTHTGDTKVILRASETVGGLKDAPENVLYSFGGDIHNIWAQELHVINGVPYIFTTVGKKEWYTVKAHVLRCKGDIENPADWEAPVPVVRKDGSELNPRGISLDMTYFEDGGKSYVMWSNRIMRDFNGGNPSFEPADIYIATVNADKPWILTSDPCLVVRPMYGWDRLQTEVDEGPFALKRGDDLFVSISGSSTEVDVLYCLGLLRTKSGRDLLKKENWEWLKYPVLTKESVKGEYGPGHNSFVKDEDGDDLIVYHAVPLDKNGKSLTRHMAIRRVHWKKDGLPYFEMTADEDIPEEYENVTCKVIVE